MTHDELRALSGGYALGILTEEERAAFDAHLASCDECAREARELAVVASSLATGVPQVDPPPALRDRVLRAAATRHDRPAAMARPRSRRVVEMLAAAAILAAVGLGLYAASLHRRIEGLEHELRLASERETQSRQRLAVLQPAADQRTQMRQVLAAADLRRIDLTGQKAAPGASGRAYWSPAHGLVAAFDNLPATAGGRVYQLWVIPPGGAPVSAGLLEREPDGRALALAATGTSARVGTVAVTLEPAGGVPAPTGDMIVAGTLSN